MYHVRGQCHDASTGAIACQSYMYLSDYLPYAMQMLIIGDSTQLRFQSY